VLAEFIQLEHDTEQLLDGMFALICFRVERDRLGLGDMYAPEISSSDDGDGGDPGQVLTAPVPPTAGRSLSEE
jgi:hypothetical protein